MNNPQQERLGQLITQSHRGLTPEYIIACALHQGIQAEWKPKEGDMIITEHGVVGYLITGYRGYNFIHDADSDSSIYDPRKHYLHIPYPHELTPDTIDVLKDISSLPELPNIPYNWQLLFEYMMRSMQQRSININDN